MHLKARQTSNIHLKSLVPLIPWIDHYKVSAVQSKAEATTRGAFSLPTNVRLAKPAWSSYCSCCTLSRGGPRCGSICLGRYIHPRDLKRWRKRSTRPRVVTRAHAEGLGPHYTWVGTLVHTRATWQGDIRFDRDSRCGKEDTILSGSHEL